MTSKKATSLQKSFGTAHAELSIAKWKNVSYAKREKGGK